MNIHVKHIFITNIVLSIYVTSTHAKYYDTKCNFIQDLIKISNVSPMEAAQWACVGRLSTHYDSGTGYVGVFQIGSQWWCSSDGGGLCNVNCSSLLDDDITDDFACAQKIYKGFGSSFDAWPGSDFCLSNQVKSTIDDCVIVRPSPTPLTKIPEVARGIKHREGTTNEKEFNNVSEEHEHEHPEDDF